MRYCDGKCYVELAQLKCLAAVASKDVSRSTIGALHFCPDGKRIASTDGHRALVLFEGSPANMRRTGKCYVVGREIVEAILESRPVDGAVRNGKEVVFDFQNREVDRLFPNYEPLLSFQEQECSTACPGFTLNGAYLAMIGQLCVALGKRDANVYVHTPKDEYSIALFDVEDLAGSWRYGVMPIRK